MSTTKNMDDRRSSPRVAYRTTGLAVMNFENADPGTARAVRIWTENFGVGGALIVSREPLDGTKVLIKLLLPQLGDSLVECFLVHTSVRESSGHAQGGGQSYWYGIKFGRRMNEAELPEYLRDCLIRAAERKSPSETNIVVSGRGSSPRFSAADTAVMAKTSGSTSMGFLLPSETDDETAGMGRSSLVPLLSAIGLAVIYVSLMAF